MIPLSRAFSLIELLVVVAIIAVLLALIMPAMDQAMYQAELAVCGTRLKAIAGGVVLYAVDYKRSYPYREQAMNNGNIKPNQTVKLNPGSPFRGFDDLPRMMPYFSLNRVFNCPFSQAVDWENAKLDSGLEFNYFMWWSWRWTFPTPGRAMLRIGQQFTWTDSAAGREYAWNLLASDYDHSFNDPRAHHSHPDADGVAQHYSWQDQAGAFGPFTYTLSRWDTNAGNVRGAVDTQAVHQDGAVRRYARETWAEVGVNDNNRAGLRFIATPVTNDGTLWPGLWINTPAP